MRDVDRHAYDPTWGVDDRHGHGTQMAGLALLGDLAQLLPTSGPVPLAHMLESVKILPDQGRNPPELYGHVTTEAAAPNRGRVFSLSVAAEDWRDRGRPSSWSAAIDQLAAGSAEEDRPRRLFFVCAGNLREQPQPDHLAGSDTESIHDPGQAWNAITVGASTERFDVVEPGLAGWTPLAEPGELSPSSTTSLTWEGQWPLKPEIVLEGGNWALSPNGKDTDCPESLSLLDERRVRSEFSEPAKCERTTPDQGLVTRPRREAYLASGRASPSGSRRNFGQSRGDGVAFAP